MNVKRAGGERIDSGGPGEEGRDSPGLSGADRGTHKDAIPWDSRGLAKALKVKVAELLE